MKKLLLAISISLFSWTLLAQQAQQSSVKIDGAHAPAWTLELKEDKKLVEKVLLDQFSETGLQKFKKEKGFRTVKGGVWSVIGTEQRDIYYRVKGNKKKATVEVLAATGYTNFLSLQNHGDQFTAIQVFLNDFKDKVKVEKHLNQINVLKEQITTTEKQVISRKKENEKMLKNIEGLQKKVDGNTKEVEQQEVLLEKLRNDLKALGA